MKEAEMAAIADMITEVLMDSKHVDMAHKVRGRR
jgi:glycine/serine hydroxymethyltransferase